MSPLIERMRGLYERQRLSGKLKLFLLLLLSVLVVSGIAVWVSLSLVYVSNASLWAMERYADQVRKVESALFRFRSAHARADAQAARDHLARADVLFSELAGQKSIFKSPAVDEDILWLTRGFSEQLGVYLYYHEQSAALGSSVRQGGQGLLERLKVIEAQKWPERQAAVVASLVASTLKVRLLQQEYMHEADAGLIPPMRAALQQAIAAALELRRKAAQDEAGIEAYIFVQEAQSLGETFERFAAFSQRRNDNGSVLFQTTLRIVDWVNVASERQRAAIVRQIVLIVSCMLLASLLLVVLGSVLGRRFVRGLAQPLTELVEMSASVVHGNYGRRITVRSPDEVGDLARSFNIMAETIQTKIEAMHEADGVLRARTEELETANRALAEAKVASDRLNASLESKVRERTQELEAVNRQLVELTVTDALSGLSNRRHFDSVLVEEWSRAQRAGQPLALLMIDIDYFKAYNDCCGHQAGDSCLRRVAGFLRSVARRAGDLVARYGGEEFVVVATDTDLAAAVSLAEALRAAVAAAAIPHPVSTLAGGTVTVSIGVAAAVPALGELPDSLMQRADAALYQAKNSGRNRVVRADAVRMI